MVRLLSILITALAVLVSIGSTAEPTSNAKTSNGPTSGSPISTRSDLPRVLLIGDSICNSYYDEVAKVLKGKASWPGWRLPRRWAIRPCWIK